MTARRKDVLWLLSALAMLVLVLLQALVTQPAAAHESRPLYIEVAERENGVVSLRWRTPPSVRPSNTPEVTLPGCTALSPAGTSQGPAGAIGQRLYDCTTLDGTPLHDEKVEIAYPLANPSVSTLLRLNRASGETHSVLAGPRETVIPLPEAATTGKVAREYLALGVEHILTGYDHLLFVACLVLISGTLRRMLITITGFTLAHSITLALAALELVRIPVPPVEAVIALSIVFLATELARSRRDTLTWRFPIAVSASFGLLHGFGFASVLGEIGLPQTEIPAALLAFNAGVEIGQIGFVVAAIALLHALRWLWQLAGAGAPLAGRVMRRLERPTGYAVGTLAAFWFVDRISGFV